MGQQREKKIPVPNSALTRFGQENSEKYGKKIAKIKKPFFQHYFQPKRDEIGRESEKKILVLNSVLTQPDLENYKKKKKKNSKN